MLRQNNTAEDFCKKYWPYIRLNQPDGKTTMRKQLKLFLSKYGKHVITYPCGIDFDLDEVFRTFERRARLTGFGEL